MFPDELDRFRAMMADEGWEYGQDDEELFEFAMHERQYRDFRSGVAKERFDNELKMKRSEARKCSSALPVQAPVSGQLLWQCGHEGPVVGAAVEAGEPLAYVQTYYGVEEIVPAVSGRIVEVCAANGDKVVKGQDVAFVRE